MGIDFSKIKLMVLDMDNTLCDTYHTLTIRQWNFVADGFEKKGRLDVAKALRRRAGKQSFISVLKDLELSEQEKRFAVKRYDDNPVKNLKLFPDANAILATPIPKILMTRGEKILQQKKIRHLRLAPFFDKIVFVGTFETKLPFLDKIIRQYKLLPREILVVGDRMEEEISDAKRLGMRAVLVRRPDWPIKRTKIKPDLTIRSLASLAKKIPKRK